MSPGFDFWTDVYWNRPQFFGFHWTDVLDTAFGPVDWGSGGGPERAPEEVPKTPRPRKWHDRELEHELELWFEDRKKYGRIYLDLPPVVLEPEVVEEVRPVFIPYEPPPVRDDTAERLALAAQRAQEAVDRLVEQANERARVATEAAMRKIEETEAMKVVAAAMVAMESEE